MTSLLPKVLERFHEDVEQKLRTAREAFGHAVTKGNASESVWLDTLSEYLPSRYKAESAQIVDSNGSFSHQIDIVIFDQQYTPFIFNFQNQKIIPAEAVYAVFEAKQTVNANLVEYAQDKVASVRTLYRTSLPIPHAGGIFPAKVPGSILGGILAFESDWSPPLGKPLFNALESGRGERKLDLGCIVSHGTFQCGASGPYTIIDNSKPATAFLFELIARLQEIATVPMIDVRAYAKWLADDPQT